MPKLLPHCSFWLSTLNHLILQYDVMNCLCIPLLILTVSHTPSCSSWRTCEALFLGACHRSATENQRPPNELPAEAAQSTTETPSSLWRRNINWGDKLLCAFSVFGSEATIKKSNKTPIINSTAVLFVRPNNPGRSVNSFLQQMWGVPEEKGVSCRKVKRKYVKGRNKKPQQVFHFSSSHLHDEAGRNTVYTARWIAIKYQRKSWKSCWVALFKHQQDEECWKVKCEKEKSTHTHTCEYTVQQLW